MVISNLYHHDSLFEYVLVSFVSGLLFVLFLLLCGKKEDKEEASATQTINVNGYPVSASENVIVDVEESVVPVQVTEVQSTCDGSQVFTTTSSTCAPTETGEAQCIVVQPPTPNTVNPAAPVIPDVEISSKENASPYARVQTNIETPLPKYEYSGNSENSGNSLYAKVQDVKREETAYAVVDIKDKDYDFVNGVLVRRKTVDRGKESITAEPGMDLYDTPVSPPLRKLPDDEIENSGASGIYETVTECENKLVEKRNDLKDNNSSDIYDCCGPGGLEVLNSTPPAAPPRDSPPQDSNGTLSIDSTVVRRGSSKEKIDMKSHKGDKNEKHDHDEKQKGGIFKSLKFGHSRKSKKNEEYLPNIDITTSEPCPVAVVDISVDVGSSPINISDDGPPPPLPSVDKLMHISAHRKQHSQSDINPLPDATVSDSSPTESPSNPDQIVGHPFSRHERPSSNDHHIHSQQQLQHSPPLQCRDISSENERTFEPITKTKNSPLAESHSAVGKNKYPVSTGHTSVSDMDTSSLLSEPDYAEITSNDSVRVKESSFDLLPGYTCIEYGNRNDEGKIPHEGNHEEGNIVTVVNGEVEGAPTYHASCHKTTYNMNEGDDDDDDYADYDQVVSASLNSKVSSGSRNSSKSGNCTTDLDDDTASGVDGVGSDTPNNVLGYGNFSAGVVDAGVCVDSDYAAIDFSARDEERRIKNLYAAIDFSSKKPRDDESYHLDEEKEMPGVMYEGTYNIIPDIRQTGLALSSTQDNSIEANPLYEEVSPQMQK